MLHILLLSLKIIGIVLAVSLGLLLLIVSLVLFVPLRYKGKAQKTDNVFTGMAKVTWLFHAVSVSIYYEKGKVTTVIRLLGINLHWLLNFIRKFRDKKQKPEENTEGGNSDEKIEEGPEELAEVKTPANSEKPLEENNTDHSEERVNEKDVGVSEERVEKNNVAMPNNSFSGSDEDGTPGDRAKEDSGKDAAIRNRISGAFRSLLKVPAKLVGAVRFLCSIPSRILGIIRKIHLTICNICDKISYWKRFLDDERTRAALRYVKDRLLRILRHVLPRKLKGELRYGFEDPCVTGQVLGAIYMIYPAVQEHLNIYPDFENQVLEGRLELKGRIYVSVLLWHALKVYFDKNFKFVFNTLLHKEEF